jgi:hypothetical protein
MSIVSSILDSSSSDDFPSPSSPVYVKSKYHKKLDKKLDKKHHKKEVNAVDKVKELERKLYEMEIKNRKLKARMK